MHDTAMQYADLFFRAYMKDATGKIIVDIGAQDVNGSLRQVAPSGNQYVGVDFVAGNGVDVILTDPYKMPFETDSIDAIVCSSCFEHSEFFWVLFLELMRILKPSGLLYLNVPSNGGFHRWPVDCWRFYPDSANALQNWARHNGTNVAMLETFTGIQRRVFWNDQVSVFVKDEKFAGQYSTRIINTLRAFTNGFVYGEPSIRNMQLTPEDQRRNWLAYYYRRARHLLASARVKLSG
jgi:SAM-dependent methyltransferase